MNNIDLETQNKIIKAIATHKNGESIIFDGSFALYRLLGGFKGGKILNNRILQIVDIDLDVVNKLEQIWYKNPKRQLVEDSYSYINELLTPIFNDCEYFKDVKLLKNTYKVKKVKNNSLKQFIIQFTLTFKQKSSKFYIKNNDEDTLSMGVDLVITNGSIEYSRESILLDDKIYKINIYEPEKYFAGKLISTINHYENYKKEVGSHVIESNLNKLKKDLIDIEYIETCFSLNEDKILTYLKILSSEKKNDLKTVFGYILKIKKEIC